MRVLGAARETRPGVEQREKLSCLITLQAAADVIAAALTHGGPEQAGVRLFVRHSQIPPELRRPAERRRRPGDVPFREEHGPGRLSGRSAEKRGADGARDLGELHSGSASVL